MRMRWISIVLLFVCFKAAVAQEKGPLSISMEEYEYSFSVKFLPLHIEGQDLRMAYMDVQAAGKANGQTIILLHGKNFFGAYWEKTIRFLSENGYRVIIPDQLGFGKSSKPDIHYSFHLLAANTKKILDTLGIKEVIVLGHSMGGMLATRFSLMYPDMVKKLVLEDPIGLEDYRTLVPYISPEEEYRSELNQSAEDIRKYFKAYFVNYKPDYDKYSDVPVRWKGSAEYPRLIRSSALTYEMIYEQPVCYEFQYISMPTMLTIGLSDRTVVGKNRVPKNLLPKAGQYPELGKRTASLIPHCTLVEIPDCGHIPHLEAMDTFHKELLGFLRK